MKEKIPTKEEITVNDFREKIRELKREEEEKGVSIYFTELDVGNLTERDKEMYEAFLRTTPDNLDDYIEKFEEYRNSVGPNNNRRNFVEYLGNRITDIQLEKMSKEER